MDFLKDNLLVVANTIAYWRSRTLLVCRVNHFLSYKFPDCSQMSVRLNVPLGHLGDAGASSIEGKPTDGCKMGILTKIMIDTSH